MKMIYQKRGFPWRSSLFHHYKEIIPAILLIPAVFILLILLYKAHHHRWHMLRYFHTKEYKTLRVDIEAYLDVHKWRLSAGVGTKQASRLPKSRYRC